MADWPANGDTDWNTKMLANLAVGHDTDGTHDATQMNVDLGVEPATATGAAESAGYTVFSNGFRIAWGDSNVTQGGTVTVNIKTALDDGWSMTLQAFVCLGEANATIRSPGKIYAMDATGFTIVNPNAASGTIKFRWIAIGR